MTEETGVFRGEVYVRPTLNQDHGSLELVSGVTMNGIEEALSSKIVELEDKAVRAALIDQGWTPPKEQALKSPKASDGNGAFLWVEFTSSSQWV